MILLWGKNLPTTSLIYSQLLEQDVFVSAFFELAALVVCEPSTVGFNMADVEVMKNLPEVCVPLLKALLASPYFTHIESSLRTKISRKRYVNHDFELINREKNKPYEIKLKSLKIVH